MKQAILFSRNISTQDSLYWHSCPKYSTKALIGSRIARTICAKRFSVIIYGGKAISQTAHGFCAKRFSVLSQTIFQSAENDFQVCLHLFHGLCCAKRPAPPPTNGFSCERVRILQTPSVPMFKVNFLPLHPSPGFHGK